MDTRQAEPEVETWEARDKRERAVALINYNAVCDNLQRVATGLGHGWSVLPNTDEESGHPDNRFLPRVRHTDGRELFFSRTRASEGRLEISGANWPKYQDKENRTQYIRPHELHPREAHPSITVSASKSPDAIAKDIARRLLPEYTRIMELCRVKAAEWSTYHTNELDTYKEACALLQVSESTNQPGHISLYKDGDAGYGYGSVIVSGSTMKLEINSMSLEMLRKIAPIICGYKGAK